MVPPRFCQFPHAFNFIQPVFMPIEPIPLPLDGQGDPELLRDELQEMLGGAAVFEASWILNSSLVVFLPVIWELVDWLRVDTSRRNCGFGSACSNNDLLVPQGPRELVSVLRSDAALAILNIQGLSTRSY